MSRFAAVTVIVVIAVLLIAATLVLFVPGKSIEVTASASDSFVIGTKMERVRKILVRTNSVKTIVAMANAVLTDQEWLNLKLENEGSLLDRNWNLSGQGKLTVLSDDPWLGKQELTLDQKIEVQPERLESTNTLGEPSNSIRAYTSNLVLTPDSNGNAEFQSRLDLTIQTRANWFIRKTAEARIREAPAKALQNMEQAIRDIVASHDDEILILPTVKQ